MKYFTRVSIALIAISLISALWSSLYLIPFVQPERSQIATGQLHYMFSYENWVHEAGFGRLAISIIALLILFIPFRKGERWAFAALVILAVTYYVPVFFYGGIPNLGMRPFVQLLASYMPQAKVVSFAWMYWDAVLFTSCLVLGLLIAAPRFFRRSLN